MLTVNTVWRDYTTDGVPGSGVFQPVKREIRELLGPMEAAIASFLGNGGLIYSTKAALNTDLAHATYSMAWVIADPNMPNNGIYQKQGATGTGSWARVADLPFTFIKAMDNGAGTPNAIQATSALPIHNNVLVAFNAFEATTASPVTVQFNGGAILTVKTATGNDLLPGGFVTGQAVLGYQQTTQFRLLTDIASASIQAAAEAAAIAAEAAADRAEAAAGTVIGDIPLAVSRTFADTATIPVDRAFTYVAGNLSAGDRGASLYLKVAAPGTPQPWHFQSTDGAWWELRERTLDARQLGFTGASATANVAALNACIQYAKAFGIREIILPEGQFDINATITVNADGIVIRGRLNASYHDAVGVNRGTILRWTGAADGVMFHYTPVLGAGSPGLSGCGLHDVYLDGMLTSGPLLKCSSTKFCMFSGLFLTRAQTAGPAALVLTVTGNPPVIGEASDLQNCTFKDFVIDQRTGSGASDCMWLTGDANANVSFNQFENFIMFHGSNNGCILGNCDNNHLANFRVYRVSGTGLGVLFAAGATPAFTARNNTFDRLYSGSGLYAQGTEANTAASLHNRVYEYDMSNGSPAPVVGTSATLLWTPDQVYVSLGINGYRTLENGLIEEWGSLSLGAGQVLAVTLPLALPSTGISVLCSPSGSGGTIYEKPPQAVFASTSVINVANTDANAMTVFWRVLGR